MQLTIRRKYTLFILSLIVFVAAVVLSITYRQFSAVSSSFIGSSSHLASQALLQSMERKGVVIAQLLAENLVNPMYTYDQNAIRKLVRGYESHRDVIRICVYDVEGRLIHDGTGGVEQYGAPVDARTQVAKALANRGAVIDRQDNVIEVYQAVALEGTVLGGVRVTLSSSEINQRIADMQTQLEGLSQSTKREGRLRLVIALAAILMMGIALSYSLALRISRPITSMAECATRIGRGEYANSLECGAKDEIGDLARAFNRMQRDLMHSTVSIQELEKQVELRTQELGRANAYLKDHEQQLEKMVAERTAELLETNRRLTEEMEERKNVQEKLVRAKKMEAIGTLAAAVAHDLNNILTGMVGIPDLVLSALPQNDPLHPDLMMIRKSGLKAAAVVQDLLNLARKNAVKTKAFDLGAVVRDQLESPEHKEFMKNCPGVNLATDIAPGKCMIMGSQVHLAKALMNLIYNGAESMPDGGMVSVSLKTEFFDPAESADNAQKKGNYAVLRVRDNGKGIPEENLSHIFEPFYTTKAMGRSGSGLGLTVVWETVRDHGGLMDVQSSVGEGTTFTLRIPLTETPEEKRADVPPEDYHGRGESVLIVDDLESQRTLLRTIINRLGYRAHTAPSGEHAVRYVKEHSVDLLILDMIMAPGMDGCETYREILKIRPGQKAIVVSGYSESARTKELQGLGVVAFIQKPYTVKEIGRAVRTELDRPSVLDDAV